MACYDGYPHQWTEVLRDGKWRRLMCTTCFTKKWKR